MAKKKKRSRGKGKGSAFEREICTKLSLWWTLDRRDDIFWRSASSGGRATSRRKHGKKRTSGCYGDVTATDPLGSSFLDVFCVELKRGYSGVTPFDVFDKLPTAKLQQWEQWYCQAVDSYSHSGTAAWMLITRRDRRRDVVYMSQHIFQELQECVAERKRRLESWDWQLTLPVPVRMGKSSTASYVVGVLLDDFFKRVAPADVQLLGQRV